MKYSSKTVGQGLAPAGTIAEFAAGASPCPTTYHCEFGVNLWADEGISPYNHKFKYTDKPKFNNFNRIVI